MGDLGGKDDIGTNDFQDLEISQTKLAAFVGYKWTMYKKLYLRLDFTYGQLSGNDNLTREQFRQNRNLNWLGLESNFGRFGIPKPPRPGH